MRGMDTVGYDVDGVAVEVRRSAKRRRTVSAYRQDDGSVVVLVPARLSRAEEREWVATMVARLDKQDRRRRPSDDKLDERAQQLSREHLEGLARPTSVRWVDNQRQRWGSCTPADGTIRLSSASRACRRASSTTCCCTSWPTCWSHDHSAAFWELVDRYPRAERAKGYLEGSRPGPALAGPDVGRRRADATALGRRTPTTSRPGQTWPSRARASRTSSSSDGSSLGRSSAGHQRTSDDSSLTAVAAAGSATARNRTSRWRVPVAAAERHLVDVELHRDGVEVEPRRARTPRWPRAGGRRQVAVARLDVTAELEPRPRLRVQGQQHLAAVG